MMTFNMWSSPFKIVGEVSSTAITTRHYMKPRFTHTNNFQFELNTPSPITPENIKLIYKTIKSGSKFGCNYEIVECPSHTLFVHQESVNYHYDPSRDSVHKDEIELARKKVCPLNIYKKRLRMPNFNATTI